MFRLKRKESDTKRRMSVAELVAVAGKHSITMQRRLLLYLCILVIVVTGILAVILFTVGSFVESGKVFKQSIDIQLKNSKKEIEERLGFLVGNCMQLSDKISFSLENEVLSYPYDIYELNDNPDKLLSVQQNLYPVLENQMKIMRVSGIFTVLDATVNTHPSNAITSRSGLYLRLANVSGGNAPNNEVFYTGAMHRYRLYIISKCITDGIWNLISSKWSGIKDRSQVFRKTVKQIICG